MEPHGNKKKITITVSNDLLRQLDRVPNTAVRSRSQVVEETLRRWLEYYKQMDLEREIEEYYHSLSKSER